MHLLIKTAMVALIRLPFNFIGGVHITKAADITHVVSTILVKLHCDDHTDAGSIFAFA